MKKNKSEWYFASPQETIGGYKCIKNSTTEELVLVGKSGEIYLYSSSVCCAWINSSSVINKFTAPKEKYKKGEERIVKFPLNDIDKWVKILGVKNNRKGMIKRAEKVRQKEE